MKRLLIVLTAILSLCSASTLLKNDTLYVSSTVLLVVANFTLTYEGTGVTGDFWIGIGFGTTMTDADAIICTYNGTASNCMDRHSAANGTVPLIDTSAVCNGAVNVNKTDSTFEEGVKYTVTFTRFLDTVVF